MAEEDSSDRPAKVAAQVDEQAAKQVAKVEEREAQATLGNDVNALDSLWSESLVVSSTENLVLSKTQALTLFRAGRIRLTTFERRISKVHE